MSSYYCLSATPDSRVPRSRSRFPRVMVREKLYFEIRHKPRNSRLNLPHIKVPSRSYMEVFLESAKDRLTDAFLRSFIVGL